MLYPLQDIPCTHTFATWWWSCEKQTLIHYANLLQKSALSVPGRNAMWLPLLAQPRNTFFLAVEILSTEANRQKKPHKHRTGYAGTVLLQWHAHKNGAHFTIMWHELALFNPLSMAPFLDKLKDDIPKIKHLLFLNPSWLHVRVLGWWMNQTRLR